MSYAAICKFSDFHVYHPVGPWSDTAESGALVPLMGTPHMMRRFTRRALRGIDREDVPVLVDHLRNTYIETWPQVLEARYGISDPEPETLDLPAGILLSVCDHWCSAYAKEAHWAVLAFMFLDKAATQDLSEELPIWLLDDECCRDQAGNLIRLEDGGGSADRESVSKPGRLTRLGSSIAFLSDDEPVFWSVTQDRDMRLLAIQQLVSEAWSCIPFLYGEVNARQFANEWLRRTRSEGGKITGAHKRAQAARTKDAVLKEVERLRNSGHPERNIASTLAQRPSMPSYRSIRNYMNEQKAKKLK